MYFLVITAAIFAAEISASSLARVPMSCPQDIELDCLLGYTQRMIEDGSGKFKCACVRENIFKEPNQVPSHPVQSPMGKRGDSELESDCKPCTCVLDSSKSHRICSQGCIQKSNDHMYCHCSITESFSPSKCPKPCLYGYAQDKHGCRTCRCKPKNDLILKSKCPKVRCPLNCEGPYEVIENNCPKCKCKSSQNDVVLKSTCPKIMCDLHCMGGLALDENECEICKCKSSHWLCPQIACTMDCIYGYVKDSNNCDTCQCIPRPILLDGGDTSGTHKE